MELGVSLTVLQYEFKLEKSVGREYYKRSLLQKEHFEFLEYKGGRRQHSGAGNIYRAKIISTMRTETPKAT